MLLALQTRELSQKKNDISQQVKGMSNSYVILLNLAIIQKTCQTSQQIFSNRFFLLVKCCFCFCFLNVHTFLSTAARVDIAERRSYIETLRRNIEKLEEEIRVKQSTVQHNKENAKRYIDWVIGIFKPW